MAVYNGQKTGRSLNITFPYSYLVYFNYRTPVSSVLTAVGMRGKKRENTKAPVEGSSYFWFGVEHWAHAHAGHMSQGRHKASGQLQSRYMQERVEPLRENSNCSPQTPWCLGDETKKMGLGTRLPTEGPTKCQ